MMTTKYNKKQILFFPLSASSTPFHIRLFFLRWTISGCRISSGSENLVAILIQYGCFSTHKLTHFKEHSLMMNTSSFFNTFCHHILLEVITKMECFSGTVTI